MADKLAERYSPHIPFSVGPFAVVTSIAVLFRSRHHRTHTWLPNHCNLAARRW
ncbi:MAG TPA: hypothetical protein VFA78_07960 [Chloroflexota bacterium]|nr:hypothetical protein [Chloroflexota bacterium]